MTCTELACFFFPLLPVSAGDPDPTVPPSPTRAYLIDWNIALTDELFTSDIIEFPSHIKIGCALVVLEAGGNYYICFDPSVPLRGFLILTFAPKVLIYHNVQQSVGFNNKPFANVGNLQTSWKTSLKNLGWLYNWMSGCEQEKKEREQEKESFSWTFITALRSPRSWLWSLLKFVPIFAAVICMCHMLHGAQVYYLEPGWPMGLWEVCWNRLILKLELSDGIVSHQQLLYVGI